MWCSSVFYFARLFHRASWIQMDLVHSTNIGCLLCVGHHSSCLFNILFLSWRKVMSFNLTSALTLHSKLTRAAFPLFWHGEDLEAADETKKDWWLVTWTLTVWVLGHAASGVIISTDTGTKYRCDRCSFALICHHRSFPLKTSLTSFNFCWKSPCHILLSPSGYCNSLQFSH